MQTESSTGLLLNLVASPSLTEIGAEPNGNLYVKVVQQVRSERACQQAAAEAPLQAGGLPRRAGPSTGEDLPPPCAPAPSPRPRLDVNARAWKKGDQQQCSCCLPRRERGVRAETACRLQQHSLGLPQRGAPSEEVSRCCGTAVLSCCPFQAR